jgi:hypothetical protein
MGNVNVTIDREGSTITTSDGADVNTGVRIDGRTYPRRSTQRPQQITPKQKKPVIVVQPDAQFIVLPSGNLSADGCPINGGALKLSKTYGEEVTCKITKDGEITFPCEDNAEDTFVCKINTDDLEFKCNSPQGNADPECLIVNPDKFLSCNDENLKKSLEHYLAGYIHKEVVGLNIGCGLPPSILGPRLLQKR